MRAALQLSQLRSTLGSEDADQILKLLEKFHLPLVLPATLSTETILGKISRDKKFSAGVIRFVLLERAGSAHVSTAVTLDDLRTAIEHLRSTP